METKTQRDATLAECHALEWLTARGWTAEQLQPHWGKIQGAIKNWFGIWADKDERWVGEGVAHLFDYFWRDRR